MTIYNCASKIRILRYTRFENDNISTAMNFEVSVYIMSGIDEDKEYINGTQ